MLLADREHVGVVPQYRLVVLDRSAVRGGRGEGGSRVGVIGAPPVRPDLALGDHALQRVDQVERERRSQVVQVQLQQVDVIGVEAAQRRLQTGHRVLGAVVLAGGPAGRLVGAVAELGGDHHLVTAAGDRPAEYPLAVPGPVIAGGVEEGHPVLDRRVHGPYRLLVVDLAPAQRLPVVAPQRSTDRPAPHPDGADLDPAAAQFPCRRHAAKRPAWSALEVKRCRIVLSATA
ncbi:hypothetical protein GCM10029963_66040 [Micromonospora andamanensis]